jgi:hypothetical protein
MTRNDQEFYKDVGSIVSLLKEILKQLKINGRGPK